MLPRRALISGYGHNQGYRDAYACYVCEAALVARGCNVSALTTTLMTPDEVAAHLRVPVDTLRSWRDRRIGPLHVKIGRHVLYRAQDVESWLKERTVDAAQTRAAQVRQTAR